VHVYGKNKADSTNIKNAIEDIRLCPRVQRIVRLHSRTLLCTATLTAEGCQSAQGPRRDSGAEALEPVCVASVAVAGPLVWNSLPDYLRDPAVSRDTFCKHLKTFLLAMY